MLKALAVNLFSSVIAAGASVVTTCVIASGDTVPTVMVAITATFSVVSVLSIAAIVLGEYAEHRAWMREQEEGRRLAARSDAEYRNRRHDPRHMVELERALSGA